MVDFFVNGLEAIVCLWILMFIRHDVAFTWYLLVKHLVCSSFKSNKIELLQLII